MDADTRYLLAFASALPFAQRWRLRVAALLYCAGLRRLAVRVTGDAEASPGAGPRFRRAGPATRVPWLHGGYMKREHNAARAWRRQ
jgi:hypothetical protein